MNDSKTTSEWQGELFLEMWFSLKLYNEVYEQWKAVCWDTHNIKVKQLQNKSFSGGSDEKLHIPIIQCRFSTNLT